MRRFGYRDPFRLDDLVGNGAMVILPLAGPVLGLAIMLSGDSAGQRVGGALLLTAGLASLFFAWQYFSRPVRPENDEDFEREIRYRLQRSEEAGGEP